ncbi:MAG: prephenate dehydrogenase/arogenate dehydrogenase family protein, partial [Gaiellaceae bacterium]|nr:prephenate dehydrogenase/arogenate dehydrogenase family protein [Gaiellaceae bacterium]
MRLGVVGTGLIGASVALAARRAGASAVRGWDADPEALATAADRGAVEPARSLGEALAGADVAVVAVPVAALPDVVRATLAAAPESCAVTDVGSTKVSVCAAAATDARFVGGHPICGAETRGPARASADLFEGAT